MSTVLAINLSEEEARIIAARTEHGKPIEILHLARCPRAALSTASATNNSSLSISSSTDNSPPEETQAENTESEQAAPSALDNLREELSAVVPLTEVDGAACSIDSRKLLYSFSELPFNDQKKVEQVAAFQVQDALPFDLDDFVIHSHVVGKADAENYRVLSSLLPKSVVSSSLEACSAIGADPRFLTTGASMLVVLANFIQPNQQGLIAYVECSTQRISLAVLLDGAPFQLRDFFPLHLAHPVQSQGNQLALQEQLSAFFKNIACSIVKAEAETGRSLQHVLFIGEEAHRDALALQIRRPVEVLALHQHVVNESKHELAMEDIAWALGLIAQEGNLAEKSDKTALVDFRQGPFAYYRAWQDLWSAIQLELFWFILVAVLGLSWCGMKIYASYAALNQVDEKIESLIQKALPGEVVPEREELTFLQSKLDEFEEQLQGLGSLSSLSPLESLKEVATALGTGIDVSLDSVNISTKRIVLRGTVGENRLVGELSTALKARADRFCEVSVDNRGKTTSSRVGFTAEIKLCDS